MILRETFRRAVLLLGASIGFFAAGTMVASERLTIAATITSDDGKSPAAFADLLLECREKVCTADAEGRISCGIRSLPVNSICIEHPSLGRTRIDVAGRSGAMNLGTVALTPGATIRVITPPHVVLPEKTTLSIVRDGGETSPAREVQEAQDFNGLKPGVYLVILAGPTPLQRKTFKVELIDRELSELNLSLEPYRLTGEVRLGKEPLPSILSLIADDWSAEVTTDDDGLFNAEVWDSAAFGVSVEADELGQPFLASFEGSPAASHWLIHIPVRKVTGKVLDGESQKPVNGATIVMKGTSGGTTYTRTITAEADGSFVVVGLADGQYTLAATASGFLADAPVTFTLRPFDSDQTADLLLWRGLEVPIYLTDVAGRPAAGALMISDIDDPSKARIQRADANGHAVWFVRKGATRTVFALPTSGGLGVVPLSDAMAGTGARVAVRGGEATLRVEARTETEAPLSGVTFKLRWDGVEIPHGVLRQFAALHKGHVVSDRTGDILLPNLPLGRYEISWVPPDRQTAAGRPVNLTLPSGETVVTQTFRVVETERSP